MNEEQNKLKHCVCDKCEQTFISIYFGWHYRLRTKDQLLLCDQCEKIYISSSVKLDGEWEVDS